MAWTAPRTWVTGEVVTAAIMNAHVRDNLIELGPRVIKSADESVTSSTTLQNDDHLVLAVDVNSRYILILDILWVGATAGDLKYAFTVPASATIFGFDSEQAGGVAVDLTGAIAVESGHGTAVQALRIVAVADIAGTSGNVQFQFAQNTSDATATTVKQGSRLMAHKVI